jgi:hypothetical protein
MALESIQGEWCLVVSGSVNSHRVYKRRRARPERRIGLAKRH